MFIELQVDEEGKKVSVNMDQVQTVSNSIRTKGLTMLVFEGWKHKDCLEVFESYESVMAKVRAQQ